MIKKKRYKWIFIFLFFAFLSCEVMTAKAYEQDKDDENTYEEGSEVQRIYDELDVDEFDNTLRQVYTDLSVKKIIQGIVDNDKDYLLECVKSCIDVSFAKEINNNKAYMVELLGVILIGGLFINISDSFGKKFISDNGFYITYIIATSIMLSAFYVALSIVENAIRSILLFIDVFIPVFYVSLTYLGYISTANSSYRLIFFSIWLLEIIFKKIILPFIKLYVIMVFLNNLNQDNKFTKLAGLIKSLIRWLLRSSVFLILGFNVIKGMINPSLDVVSKSSYYKLISFVPGGNYITSLSGSFLAAGMVVKNGIGLAGLITILIILLVPLIKLIVFFLMTKIISVIIEPLGEKRYVNGIEGVAEGLKLLLITGFSSALLFMITLASTCYITSSGMAGG